MNFNLFRYKPRDYSVTKVPINKRPSLCQITWYRPFEMALFEPKLVKWTGVYMCHSSVNLTSTQHHHYAAWLGEIRITGIITATWDLKRMAWTRQSLYHAYIGDWEDSEYTQIRLLNQWEFFRYMHPWADYSVVQIITVNWENYNLSKLCHNYVIMNRYICKKIYLMQQIIWNLLWFH